MQLKTILNHLDKHKSFVFERVGFADGDESQIEVTLRARTGSEPVCSGCLRKSRAYGRLAQRRFDFVPLWGIPLFFSYAMRRKEEFQLVWEYVSPAAAGKFMDRWCTKALRSRIEPMKKMARTIRGHQGLILNWFRARGCISSGAVEGLNNKLKVTVRKSYGFRTFRVIEVALHHALGKLPEPAHAHGFF